MKARPKEKTSETGAQLPKCCKNTRYGDLDSKEAPFRQIWHTTVLASRVYELVRCLPYFKDIQKEISAEELQALKSLPPYPDLTSGQKNLLLLLFNPRPPIRLLQNEGSVPSGYTSPLPPLAFDRRAMSKTAILDYIGLWLEAEDRRLGLPHAKGKKGKTSRNQDQKYKVPPWEVVELAQPRAPGQKGFNRAQQKRREAAKKHALKFYEQVLLFFRMGQAGILAPSLRPPLPGSLGKRLRFCDLTTALQRVIRKQGS